MKKQNTAVLVLPLIGVCALLMAEVKTDYDRSANFGRYHTYTLAKVQAGNELWQDRISRAVDNTLQARGWQKVPSGGDATVTAFGATKNEQTLQTFYDGFGGGWFWRGFGPETATTTVENTPVGTLTVDIFDTRSKHLIFRGTSSNTLSGDPEKNEKKLDNSVMDMFKHFPPKAKG